jgi:hypothetical protein
MMGWRIECKGRELDAVTGWRRRTHWGRGKLRWWKRNMRRRARHEARWSVRRAH